MSESESPLKPQIEGRSASADDVLPPVEPPNARFILQLFFIPLVIVAIVILVWLMFSWIAQAGSDPRDLVDNLKRHNDASWQSALSLAEQLKNPEYDHLKEDHGLAKSLVDVLREELESGRTEDSRLQLRVFLCRSLGEFRVLDGLDVLLQAARQEKVPAEIHVRAAAVESLAVMASNEKLEGVRGNEQVLEALLEASRVRRDDDKQNLAAELRSRAAYALGVYGGDAALDRLAQLLDDSYPNVRYNAATGLARRSDPRSVPTLRMMLDPTSDAGLVDEQTDGEKQRKRTQILLNGVRAAYQLLYAAPEGRLSDDDVRSLEEAFRRLAADREHPVAADAATDALGRLKPAK